MTERLTAEAQAALDAVRELMGAAQSYLRDGRYFAAESMIKSAIKRTEDLDARLKALEEKK